jgi:GT2 family glycosyltransferase
VDVLGKTSRNKNVSGILQRKLRRAELLEAGRTVTVDALPQVSFVIPVRNDAAGLAQCLRSIEREREGYRRVETIVVDGGSTDGSQDVAARMGARVIAMPNARVAAMRNVGAAEATGDILAFVDADNEIVTGWLVAAVNALQTPGVAAAGALCLAPPGGTWVQHAYESLRGRTPGQQYVDWLGSGNLAIWREAFHSLRGFDESLETCEDVDLCRRMRSRGLRIVEDARMANVHHGDPRTLRDLFQGELWRGRDNLRVSFRRPMAWSLLPSAVVPVVDMLMIAVGVIGIVASVRWPQGLVAAFVASIVFTAGAFLRVARARMRLRDARAGFLRVFIVACVYDLGRALALIARAPHRSQPRATPDAP